MPANGGLTSDQVILSAFEALTASHSFGATTPMKPFCQTTWTPGISLTDASSTATGTAPATGGRITRPCSMPGTLTSTMYSSLPSTFSGTSRRARAGLADGLVFGRRLRLGLALDQELVAGLVVPFELNVEVPPADQLAVSDLLGRIALVADGSVSDAQSIGRHAKLFGRHLHAARDGPRRRHCARPRRPSRSRSSRRRRLDRW